jgi:hypothetical protein
MVVVLAPVLDHHARLREAGELLDVEQLVADFPVEALNVRVLDCSLSHTDSGRPAQKSTNRPPYAPASAARRLRACRRVRTGASFWAGGAVSRRQRRSPTTGAGRATGRRRRHRRPTLRAALGACQASGSRLAIRSATTSGGAPCRAPLRPTSLPNYAARTALSTSANHLQTSTTTRAHHQPTEALLHRRRPTALPALRPSPHSRKQHKRLIEGRGWIGWGCQNAGASGLRGWLFAADRLNLSRVMPA